MAEARHPGTVHCQTCSASHFTSPLVLLTAASLLPPFALHYFSADPSCEKGEPAASVHPLLVKPSKFRVCSFPGKAGDGHNVLVIRCSSTGLNLEDKTQTDGNVVYFCPKCLYPPCWTDGETQHQAKRQSFAARLPKKKKTVCDSTKDHLWKPAGPLWISQYEGNESSDRRLFPRRQAIQTVHKRNTLHSSSLQPRPDRVDFCKCYFYDRWHKCCSLSHSSNSVSTSRDLVTVAEVFYTIYDEQAVSALAFWTRRKVDRRIVQVTNASRSDMKK